MGLKIMLIDDDSDDQELFIEALMEIDASIDAVVAVSATESFEKTSRSERAAGSYLFGY